MPLYLKSWNGYPDPVEPRESLVGYIPGLTLDKLKLMQSRNVIVGGDGGFLMREHVIRGTGEFVNTWVVYLARLPDGETYEATFRLKPSEVAAHGGNDGAFNEWDVTLGESHLKELQAKALESFGKRADSLRNKGIII